MAAGASEDWDVTEQQAFWAEPGTLDWALDELDADRLEATLEEAFFEDVDNGTGGRKDQWEVIGGWAAATASDTSVEVTVECAVPLLRSLWAADADDPAGATGLSSVVVTSAMYATGTLPSYDDHLASHLAETASADGRVAFVVNTAVEASEEEIDAFRAQ